MSVLLLRSTAPDLMMCRLPAPDRAAAMDRLLDQTRSQGLPPFLADEVGVDSGLMIAHYTAAAMASENKRLAAPASVDSLPCRTSRRRPLQSSKSVFESSSERL